MKIQQRNNTATTDGFRWRDRQGGFHLPKSMVTRHLFFTLRMIWNHSMPEDARTHGFLAYTFSSYYTGDYMKKAVRALAEELATRTDMEAEWKRQLEMMKNYLLRNPHALADSSSQRIE